MTDKVQVELGDVQQTLFIMLAARARQTGLRHPVLRDTKAVEIDTDRRRMVAGSLLEEDWFSLVRESPGPRSTSHRFGRTSHSLRGLPLGCAVVLPVLRYFATAQRMRSQRNQ